MAEYKSKHTGAEIDASIDRVNDGGSLPDYWKTHIDARIVDIRAVLESAGWNKSAFLWYHDAHWTDNYQRSPDLLKYLYKNTPINKTNFGGDICMAESDNRADMLYLWDWRKAIRDLPNHHSVIGNHDDGNGSNGVDDGEFSDGYIYSWLLEAEETPDIVRGDKFYYYIDNPSEKTRYLYLDTASMRYKAFDDNPQRIFIKDALLSTPNGWHVVAISHIWKDVNYTVSPPAVKDGWNSSAEACLEIFYDYNKRNGVYANCGGKVEFCIGGHTHVDGNWLYNGTIPVILTECDSKQVRSGLTYAKGTINESAVSAVIADYNAKKIHIIRIGRGYEQNGNITVDIPASASYTNVLPLATDETGGIYNGVGYKENMRINSSHVPTSDGATGWDLTGFIGPLAIGDVIRFKDVAFMDMTGANGSISRAVINFYDAEFNWTLGTADYSPSNLMSAAWNAVYDEDGNVKQFTIPTSYKNEQVVYMRICADDFNENSIITINEEIV